MFGYTMGYKFIENRGMQEVVGSTQILTTYKSPLNRAFLSLHLMHTAYLL